MLYKKNLYKINKIKLINFSLKKNSNQIFFNNALHNPLYQQNILSFIIKIQKHSYATHKSFPEIELSKEQGIIIDEIKKENLEVLNKIDDQLKNENLYHAAVKIDGYALKYVPKEFRTEKIILAAVNNNPKIYDKLLNDDEKTENVHLEIIRQDHEFINTLPRKALTMPIMTTAVKIDSKVLTELPSEFHEDIIDQVGFKNIARSNYDVFLNKKTIPKKYYQAWDEVLSSTRTVITTDGYGTHEILDTQAAYAELPENKDASIHTSSHHLKDLFNDLSTKNPKNIKLVFLDHHSFHNYDIFLMATPSDQSFKTSKNLKLYLYQDDKGPFYLTESNYQDEKHYLSDNIKELFQKEIFDQNIENPKKCNNSNLYQAVLEEASGQGHISIHDHSIAQCSANEIMRILEQYQFINEILLLGCNTAKAKLFDPEKKMIEFAHQNRNQEDSYGFVLTNQTINKNEYETLFKQTKLNKVFILIKEDNETHLDYRLILIKNEGKISAHEFNLTDEDFNCIERSLNHGKKLNFPKKLHNKHIIRDKQNPLKEKEFITISATANHSDTNCSHNHIIVNEDQLDKLTPSLLKLLSKKIQENPNIKQDIQTTGYTKSVYMDLINKKIIPCQDNLYISEYRNYPNLFFHTKQDNINRSYLRSYLKKENERSVQINHGLFSKEKIINENKTLYDVITVKIKKEK